MSSVFNAPLYEYSKGFHRTKFKVTISITYTLRGCPYVGTKYSQKFGAIFVLSRPLSSVSPVRGFYTNRYTLFRVITRYQVSEDEPNEQTS